MLFQPFQRHLNLPQGSAIFILELGQNLIFFSEDSKDRVCAHDVDYLGEG